MPDDFTLWVNTDPAADGTYTATLELGDDLAVPLDRDTAIRHALGVLTASQYAQYDAAVIRQLTGKLGMPMDGATVTVARLRQDRPPLNPDDTAPLVLTPGVSQQTGDGFVAIHLDGEQVGQFDADTAAQHARYVLDVSIAAELDGAYRRCLRSLGLEDGHARAMVGDLADWRTPTGAGDV